MPDPNLQVIPATDAWKKAQHIGPNMGETPLPTPAQEADPIRKLIQLSGLTDPFGLSENAKSSPATMGGLPDGLNPLALEETFKRAMPYIEEAPSAIGGGIKSAIGGLKSAISGPLETLGNAFKQTAPVDLTNELNELAMPSRDQLMQSARDRSSKARAFHFNAPQD